jgi:hypothetical protein
MREGGQHIDQGGRKIGRDEIESLDSKSTTDVENKLSGVEVKLYVPFALNASLPSSTSSFDAQHPNLMAGQPFLSFF